MIAFRLLGAACASVALVPGAFGAVAYDESSFGDLSNVGTSPTSVSLAAGANLVLGSTGNAGAGIDLDYFNVTVPVGMKLVALTVQPGTTVVGGVSFIGLQGGSQVTVSPTGGSAAGLLGWTHYGTADIGGDILPRIGTGFGAVGFTAPLSAGTYSFWVQDTGFGTAHYGFDLNVAAVPESSTSLLLLAGLAALGLAGRRPTGGAPRH
jgi:hypothetical protein